MAGKWVWAAVLIVTGCSGHSDWSSQNTPSPSPPPSGVPTPSPIPMFDPQISRGWTWQECGTIAANPSVVRAKFAPDGQTVAIQLKDGTIVLKAPEHLAPAKVVLHGHGGDFVFSRDGTRLAEMGTPISIFQTSDGSLLKEISDPANKDCTTDQVAFSEHGDDVLGYGSGPLCVWNVGSAALTARLSETPKIHSAAFRAIGAEPTVVVVARQDDAADNIDLRTHDLQGLEIARPTVEMTARSTLRILGLSLRRLVLSPNGEAFGARVSTVDGKTTATVWSTRDGHVLFRRELPPDPSGRIGDDQLVFSPDGGMVTLAGGVFETAGFQQIGNAPGLGLGELSLSPRGDKAVYAKFGFAGLSDTTAKRARLLTNHPIDQTMVPLSLDIALDGRTLLVGNNAVVSWQLADRFADSEPTWVGALPEGGEVHVSPDGHFAAGAGDGRYLANLDTGEVHYIGDPPPPALTAPFDGLNGTLGCVWLGLRFSHSGRWVAGAGYGNGVDVFDVQSAAMSTRLVTSGCNAKVAFSADDRFLFTARGEKFETSTWKRVAASASNEPLGPVDDVDVSTRDELLTSTCRVQPGMTCDTRLSGTAVPALTAAHPRFSPEGNWIVAGGSLFHGPTQETRAYDSDALVALFTPSGDIISVRRDGTLARYCRSDNH